MKFDRFLTIRAFFYLNLKAKKKLFSKRIAQTSSQRKVKPVSETAAGVEVDKSS